MQEIEIFAAIILSFRYCQKGLLKIDETAGLGVFHSKTIFNFQILKGCLRTCQYLVFAD